MVKRWSEQRRSREAPSASVHPATSSPPQSPCQPNASKCGVGLGVVLLLVLFATSDLHRSREADVRGDGTRRGGVYTATAAKLKKWTAHGNATPGRGAAAALPTDETDAGGCAVWRCTCLGYSNHFDAWPNHWGSAVTEPHRQWWLAQHCATTPNRAESLTERPNDAVIKSAVVAGGAPAAETQKPPSHPSPPPPHPSPPPPFPSPSSASTFEPSSPRAATQFVVNDRAGPACEAGGRPIASPLDCSSAVARIRGADNFGGKGSHGDPQDNPQAPRGCVIELSTARQQGWGSSFWNTHPTGGTGDVSKRLVCIRVLLATAADELSAPAHRTAPPYAAGGGSAVCDNPTLDPVAAWPTGVRCLTIYDNDKQHGIGSIFQSMMRVAVVARAARVPFCMNSRQYGSGDPGKKNTDSKALEKSRRAEYWAGHTWPSDPSCSCCAELGWGCCYGPVAPREWSEASYPNIRDPAHFPIAKDGEVAGLNKWLAPRIKGDSRAARRVRFGMAGYTHETLQWLRSGLNFSGFPCPYPTESSGGGTAAVHLRRGDAVTERRLHKIAPFIPVLRDMAATIPKGTPIHVITEGAEEDFAELMGIPGVQVKLVLGGDAYNIYTCFAQAKYLAVSVSMFSMTAAILGAAEHVWFDESTDTGPRQLLNQTGATLHEMKFKFFEEDQHNMNWCIGRGLFRCDNTSANPCGYNHCGSGWEK